MAKIDVTPDYPIRLNGYAARPVEVTGAAQHIFAKALAIGGDREEPAIFITLDNCILPPTLRDELVRRLHKKAGVDPDRVAICASHTHSAPCLTGAAPNLFASDVPPADQAHIDRYTRELMDKLEEVCLAALKDRRPGTLAWGQDQTSFAANRRTAGGPVDHDLPFLVVTDARGRLRAVLANYACHCTTLGGGFTEICGDWAGYAQEYLEQDHPGVIAMTAIGCGADANPSPLGTLELTKKHGREFADAVNRSLSAKLAPLSGKLECRVEKFNLPLDTLPTREQWEALGRQTNAVGYNARKNLARLDRGEKLETEIPYTIQTWNFGNDLALVFLAGEVVVDYSLRLKKEFDPARLWVNAYANDVPGYIPSERVLREGGYEGGGAMIYYDHPARFAPGVEDLIIGAVHRLLPAGFTSDEKKNQFPPAKSPADSLAALRTESGMTIELVASEPLIESPVAIDWGPDGKLWVVEMRDYPQGMDNNWKPGGRIKYLEATHGDGKYDRATVFLDGIPFPTGVMAWHDGALICTAPDILFAQATRGGTYANIVEKVLSGFFTDNYQARVNGLSYGLDNWVYGANGLLGGVIHGMAGGGEFDIRGRDFRLKPETGLFEPAAGLTQQGRVRDDWGNWFGCDNSDPLWIYPLPDHYLRRNPHITAPSPRVYAATGSDPGRVYPISHLLERFNDPGSANHVTSGCGLGIYRDNLLGDDYYENSFTCEPVGNVVYRLKLREDDQGALATGARADTEQDSDFLASRDNWFRPVQARTGPDGALYVVDMYRFVIEHPRWIARERLAQLDVRAGANRGRIYRIYPTGQKLRPVPNVKKLSTAELAAALDTSNGTLRDLVHLELVQRADHAADAPLADLAAKSKLPAVRIQALCALDGLRALAPGALEIALADSDVHVRRQAIRLSETQLGASPAIQSAVLKLVDDPGVRYQLALSLGEWNDPRAGQALGQLARTGISDPWLRAAILSSSVAQTAGVLQGVLATPAATPNRGEAVDELIATAAGQDRPEILGGILLTVAPQAGQAIELWQFSVLKTLLDVLKRKGLTLESFAAGGDSRAREAVGRIQPMFAAARKLAGDASAEPVSRETAVRLLGYDAAHQDEDVQTLGSLLNPTNALPIQTAAVETLRYNTAHAVPGLLLANWARLSPSLRAPILEILLSREEFTLAMLDAVQKGDIQAMEIPAASRQRLLKHSNQSIQTKAAAILNSHAPASRAEVMAQYQGVTTLTGDPAKGRPLFAKTCATCHLLKGQGFAVGPDLALLADKTPGDFLLAILDPNAAVEPRFIAYNVQTRDERFLSGVVSAESSTSLTLVQPGGIQEKILRGDITEIKASGLSLMPEGLEQTLGRQDLADLIAFLRTSPAPFGSASPEKTANARKKFLADGPGAVAKLVSTSEEMEYPCWLGTLTFDHCRQTDGKSKVVWQTSPVPSVIAPAGTQKFRLPVGMGLFSQPAGKFSLHINGQPALDFDVALNDQAWPSADGKVQMTYTVMENNREDSNGVLLIEVANALLEAGKPVTFEVTGSAANSQRWFGLYRFPAGTSALAPNP